MKNLYTYYFIRNDNMDIVHLNLCTSQELPSLAYIYDRYNHSKILTKAKISQAGHFNQILRLKDYLTVGCFIIKALLTLTYKNQSLKSFWNLEHHQNWSICSLADYFIQKLSLNSFYSFLSYFANKGWRLVGALTPTQRGEGLDLVSCKLLLF